MLLAPEPIANKLRMRAREWISALRQREYSKVWNHLITLDAMDLISTTSFPVALSSRIDEEGVDAILSDLALDAVSFAFQMDYQAPDDEMGARTAFFAGLSQSLESMGWFEEFRDEASYGFLWEDAAILVAETADTGRTILLPMIDTGDREYLIDLEAFAAFSTQITAQRLHRLATRAMEVGHNRTALSLYELTTQMLPTYTRLRRLTWDHPYVGTLLTAQRKEELQSEYAYTLLAKEMLSTLLADPQLTRVPVQLQDFLSETFRGYDQIINVEVTDEDISCLNGMNDNSLRLAVADILVGVDRVEAQREARKPHTSSEIADMEVLVTHGDRLYHLLMPVKSGVEIKGSSVPVDVFYQILRPHMFFQNGVVVFITAKPCSQPLHNYMKQARDRLGWPIGVIESRDLARLLKLNGLLPGGES